MGAWGQKMASLAGMSYGDDGKKPKYKPTLSGAVKAVIGNNASCSISKSGDYLDVTIKYDHVPTAIKLAEVVHRVMKVTTRLKYTEFRSLGSSIIHGKLTLWIKINKYYDTNNKEKSAV